MIINKITMTLGSGIEVILDNVDDNKTSIINHAIQQAKIKHDGIIFCRGKGKTEIYISIIANNLEDTTFLHLLRDKSSVESLVYISPNEIGGLKFKISNGSGA